MGWLYLVEQGNNDGLLFNIANELDVPAYCNIGIAFNDNQTLSIAAARFLEYLDCI